MEKVKLVLVGLGGYGGCYIEVLRSQIDPMRFTFEGVVDPFAQMAKEYPWVREQGIPVYETLEDFYREREAQLAIVVSPIPLHHGQVICALEHGSHVLCEKPVAATVQEAIDMREAAARCGRKLGIGFQWSFSDTMLSLKRDILSGLYGRPVMLKTFISWMRYDGYYENGWKGRIRDGRGNWVLDSVVSNATAHYLHNLFFLMGERLDAAAWPRDLRAGLYRAKEIESFDSCFLSGSFPNGGEFCYVATHAAEIEQDPVFEYRFEKGVVSMDAEDAHVTARLADGRTIDYGYPQSLSATKGKTACMLRACVSDEQPACTVDTALPHLSVCNALFDQCDIREFPPELLLRTKEPAGIFVRGLFAEAARCYEEGKLPDALGLAWAQPSQPVELAGYAGFEGGKYRGI